MLIRMEYATGTGIKVLPFSATTNASGNVTSFTGLTNDKTKIQIIGSAMETPQNCASFPYTLNSDNTWRLKVMQVSNNTLVPLVSTACTGSLYYIDI